MQQKVLTDFRLSLFHISDTYMFPKCMFLCSGIYVSGFMQYIDALVLH